MKTGRNDPCPCGSGKRYKNCCLGKPLAPKRKKTYTLIGIITALSIAAGVGLGVMTSPEKGLLAGVIGAILVVVVIVSSNPPSSRGTSGADRIGFGR